MEMKNNKQNNPITAEEWDISEGMGILPDDISFTQNIGCVGGKTKTAHKKEKTKNPTQKLS